MNIDPQGGESEIRRGLTPDGLPLGRRDAQVESWQATFERDVLKGGQDFDFTAMKMDGWKGTLTEHAGIDTRNFYSVKVESVKGTTGENGKTESITLSMLFSDGF
jgi:hypothetical protein